MMKNIVLNYLILFLFIPALIAQDRTAKKFAKTITKAELEEHLTFIASDSLEGRETGARGQKIAAEYIANHFEALGLEPVVETADGQKSYFQPFSLQRAKFNTVYLKKGDDQKNNFEDFLYYSRNETYGEEFIEVIFAGEGDSLTLKELDISDKYVAFINSDWTLFRSQLTAMKESNAKGYIMIIEDEQKFSYVMNRYGNYLGSPKMDFSFDQTGSKILIAGSSLTEWIFGESLSDLRTNGLGKTAKLLINADMHIEPVISENVLGFLKGSEKPEEVVVVTAHYDHVGIINGEIHNGADDDGSGTVSVLEIAEAFSKAAAKGNRPKRSILFMTVSGEEKGLLGSKYYTDKSPIFPLENTVANLNIDMVGRVDEAHKDNPYYIYVIVSDKLSQELHQVSENANNTYTKLEFDYTYNDENDPNRYYYRSDHYNFAKNNIPVIFYFNGSHEDYHRPTDTVEKIQFDKMERIAQLVYYTTWELANRSERIKLD
jgi:hypothetical protein